MKTNSKINPSFRAASAATELSGKRRLAVFAALAFLWTLSSAIPGAAQDRSSAAVAVPERSAGGQAPLSNDERAELLKLIADLQARVTKLEAAAGGTAAADKTVADAVTVPKKPDASGKTEVTSPDQAAKTQEKETWGKYTPNLGYKVVDTEYGDMSISIYTYARYLNQLNLDPTYVDAFGLTKSVQQRQDVQLQKLQIKFLGWIMNPKFRYFLYAWTSNANQGLGAPDGARREREL